MKRKQRVRYEPPAYPELSELLERRAVLIGLLGVSVSTVASGCVPSIPTDTSKDDDDTHTSDDDDDTDDWLSGGDDDDTGDEDDDDDDTGDEDDDDDTGDDGDDDTHTSDDDDSATDTYPQWIRQPASGSHWVTSGYDELAYFVMIEALHADAVDFVVDNASTLLQSFDAVLSGYDTWSVYQGGTALAQAEADIRQALLDAWAADHGAPASGSFGEVELIMTDWSEWLSGGDDDDSGDDDDDDDSGDDDDDDDDSGDDDDDDDSGDDDDDSGWWAGDDDDSSRK